MTTLNRIKKTLRDNGFQSTINGNKSDKNRDLIFIATDKKSVAYVNIGSGKNLNECASVTEFYDRAKQRAHMIAEKLHNNGLTTFSHVKFSHDIDGKMFVICASGQVGVQL